MKVRAGTQGFTLVELIMVVFILAIIASIAVTQMGNVQKTSAEKVSIANQQSTSRAVSTYLILNNGSGLNNLDGLIDYGTASGTVGTFAGNAVLNDASTPGGVYRGAKAADGAGTPAAASLKDRNKGIDSGLSGKVSVYYLTSGNVTALQSLGLNRIYYHNYTTGRANASPFPSTNLDGTAVTAAPGFRIESTAAYQVALTNGTAVLAIDPLKGASIYKSFGHDLALPSGATDAMAQAAASTNGWYLLAFGLGDQASIVGNRKGGLDSAPRCESLGTEYYRQYLIVVRIPTSPNAFSAEFAGIIDPKGQAVKDAKFATDWRNG